MRNIRMHPFAQSLGLFLLCLALGVGSAAASHKPGHAMEGHHGEGHHGYAHHKHGGKGGMWGMDMFAYVPMGILHQKDLLGLSDEQVQKIRSIKKEMCKAAGGSHETIEQIHGKLEAALKGGKFDLSAYESAVKEAADYFVQARLQTARKAQEALQVLSQDQRTKFLYAMEVIHSWMESHGMKHHGYGMDDDDMDDGDRHDMNH
ncbi:MAG: Spy/CpxP family protein refolding chaperone [Nitrococcus sp.]|nr:Spy/CpxP family protein refolding chaperone [Nitrococcus sp.]